MKSKIMKSADNNQQDLAKMLKETQQQMELSTEKIDKKQFKTKSSSNDVEIVAFGNKNIVEINSAENLIEKFDLETAVDIVISTINKAFDEIDAYTESELNRITKAYPIPNSSLITQIQENMQDDMSVIENKKITEKSKDGTIEVVVMGNKNIVEINIDQEKTEKMDYFNLIKELKDLINAALKKVDSFTNSEILKIQQQYANMNKNNNNKFMK